MLLEQTTKVDEDVIRLHEIFGHPLDAAVGGSTMQIDGTDSGIKGRHSLRNQRGEDAGQDIAASCFGKSGVARPEKQQWCALP